MGRTDFAQKVTRESLLQSMREVIQENGWTKEFVTGEPEKRKQPPSTGRGAGASLVPAEREELPEKTSGKKTTPKTAEEASRARGDLFRSLLLKEARSKPGLA